jgi:acyl carrier protein
MSVRATIISQLEEIRRVSVKAPLTGKSPLKGKALPQLTDELVMLDSGLDSLGIAILVTRLEDTLGLDPFTDSDITSPPVTLGDFIQLYEHASQSR